MISRVVAALKARGHITAAIKQAMDGSLLQRAERATEATARLLGNGRIDSAHLESELVNLFKIHPIAMWRARLRGQDIAVQPLNSLSVIRAASLDSSRPGRTVRFIREQSHPFGRAVEHIDPTTAKSIAAPIVPLSPAPKYGSGICDVLREVGVTEDEVGYLLTAKVAAQSGSADYLPN